MALRGRQRRTRDSTFRDQTGIPTMNEWQPQIMAPLQTSSVLVCVTSPCYFASRFCGQEFYVFDQRRRAANPNTPLPVILPIVWAQTRGAPPGILDRVQWQQGGMDPDYEGKGLRFLNRCGGVYPLRNDFWSRQCERLADVARYSISGQRPAIHKTFRIRFPGAFGRKPRRRRAGFPGPASPILCSPPALTATFRRRQADMALALPTGAGAKKLTLVVADAQCLPAPHVPHVCGVRPKHV